MNWYIPSYNGDFRLTPDDANTTLLTVEKPTPFEKKLLNLFVKDAYDADWIDETPDDFEKPIMLKAPFDQVAPVLVSRTTPARTTLTAVKFADGHLEVCESREVSKLAKKAKSEEAVAAVSVKRPTPSCPQCEPGSVAPAREVLLQFLDEQQHRDWAEHRAITVEGGDSGNTYLIAHRHSLIARRIGRIAMDCSDHAVMHFFDWSVPPEEEVLAAALILESREHWLRNEATKMHGHRYKNPFGDKWEGFDESVVLGTLGTLARFVEDGTLPRDFEDGFAGGLFVTTMMGMLR